MGLRQTLREIVLAGAITASGCAPNYSAYSYDGRIGEEIVTFYTNYNSGCIIPNENTLKVIKPDGRVIVYSDFANEDLKLESVEITLNGQTVTYTNDNEIGRKILAKAQKQFDYYLRSIKAIKIRDGLENLD